MATTTIRNGVDVDRLVATIDAIKSNPSVGTFTFRAGSTWESGARNTGRIEGFTHNGTEATRSQGFELQGDEPPVLLGSDTGPNAVELVLQALAFCYGVGVIYNAAAPRVGSDRRTPAATSSSSCASTSRTRRRSATSSRRPCRSIRRSRCSSPESILRPAAPPRESRRQSCTR
jgi:hypothetical protein